MHGYSPTTTNLLKKTTVIFAILALFSLSQANNDLTKLENIAKFRPVSQSSVTEGASKAVDGKPETCAKTTVETNPWWSVDLGKDIWVKRIRINATMGSSLDIRIGRLKGSWGTGNLLCGRVSLLKPRDFSCAESMLGRYVHIQAKGILSLRLCEVEVFINNKAKNETVRIIDLQGDKERNLNRTTFRQWVNGTKKEMQRNRSVLPTELILDLPPQERSLRVGDRVILLVKRIEVENGTWSEDFQCGISENQQYLHGTVVKHQNTRPQLNTAIRSGSYEGQAIIGNVSLNCNRTFLRIPGADICDLEVSCPAFSHCDTKYIWLGWSPASYYCVCDIGYVPSVVRPGNYIFANEHCSKQTVEPFIRHSRQNLALEMETQASSTDSYNGCRDIDCPKRPAFSRFAVDGTSDTCFLSLWEYRPWFLVKLDRYHPIALIHVVLGGERIQRKKHVFIEGKNHTTEFLLCGDPDTRETVCSITCKTDEQNFIWGNGVKITADEGILHLCDVQIYAETYANIALKRRTQLLKPDGTRKDGKTDSLASYGVIQKCFKSQWWRWHVMFGGPLRVAMVFVLLENPSSTDVRITVIDEEGQISDCRSWSDFNTTATYLSCDSVLVGTEVRIEKRRNTSTKFCDVEIFQTTIINLAARRPTYSPRGKNPELGVNQLIDRPFHASGANESARWCVDLLVAMDIHLVRIITDVGYRRHHLVGLRILVDKAKMKKDSCPEGKIVAELKHPTNKRVQSIVLPKNTTGRVVTLHLPGKKDLRFREVEIYNGALPGINECAMPGGVCDTNYECLDTENSYSCVCRGGFKYEIQKNTKRCVDIDECAESNPCPIASSYCRNTVGSYHCLCTKGYKTVFNVNESSNVCQDINECHDISLFSCPNKTKCVNLQGNYTCECEPGYKSSGKTRGLAIKCKDINECERKTNECHKKATCTNLNGSYSCACLSGLQGDGKHLCTESEYCQDGKCSQEHRICKTIKGTKVCECKDGYKNEFPRCTDINECLLDGCGNNSICTNTKGSFHCQCKPGFQSTSGDGKDCSDINECAENILLCGSEARCINKPATYECVCEKGFSLHKANMKCFDTDECKDNPDICGPHTTCHNVPGSFNCSCKEGFISGEGELHCTDINECLLDACGSNSICTNTKGSFHCKCKPGFQSTSGDGKDCSDINECLLDGCGSNSICTNTKGSFHCKCKPGFQSTSGDGKDCSDINECAENTLLCGSGARCINKPATYECVCEKGFSLHKANMKCFDTDECKEDPDICGPHTTCHNVPGSFDCSCKEGFISEEGELRCTDVDECANNKYKCNNNSFCENTKGSYICKCESGFRKNHRNQCEEKCSEDCPKNAACVQAKCKCLPGYRKGPKNKCYDDSIWLPFFDSGPSLQSSTTLTALGAFYCVLALKLF